MSADANENSSRTPTRWGLYLPFIALFLLCAVWSGFWYYTAGRIGTVMDEAFAREAKAGRDWSCPNRRLAGFPFRILLTCDAPRFVSHMQGRAGEGSLSGLSIEARAIEPTRAIATLAAPLTIDANGASLVANWRDARSSLSTDTNRLSDFSLDIQGLTVSATMPGQAPLDAKADRVNLNFAVDGFDKTGLGQFKLAAKLETLSFPALDAISGSADPVNLELQALGSKVPPGIGPDWRLNLEAWRQAGGGLKIILFDLHKGATQLHLSGDVSLDENHRPSGRLQASFQNLDRLAAQFGVGPMASMVRSGKLPMLLTDGRLFIGPLPLAKLPPLY